MQPIEITAPAFYAVLEAATPGDPRDLTWLIEIYPHDTLPGADGYDPADAVERFAFKTVTWLGHAYRKIVTSAADVRKTKGALAGSFSITLSNADENRYAANWVQSTQVEGMRLVLRLISNSTSTTLARSATRFTGKCEKPDGFDVISGKIAAKEEIADTDYQWPPRSFTADDPEGRSPADPLSEHFPYITLRGTFTYALPDQNRNFNRADPRRYVGTQPYSSLDDTPLGEPLPLFLGRTQHTMPRGVYVDEGRRTKAIDWIGMGPIAGVLNFRQIHDPDYARFFNQPQSVTVHLGLEGAANLRPVQFPAYPYFSNTAYVDYYFDYIGTGAFTNIDAGQMAVATILGLVVDLPNSSGVFNQTGWTDNGAYLTRYLLTNSRFFNIDPAYIEDAACYQTGLYNDRPVLDATNSELIYVPNPESGLFGADVVRYNSTGLINTRRARYVLGIDSDMPEELAANDFDGYDPFDPPVVAVAIKRLRKRFTTNCILKKRVSGLRFLYNTILPSYRGFLVWNYRGKIEPRSEREADFAHLRAATSAGATTLPVEDVTPWTATNGLWGSVVTGAGLATSERRKVVGAAYTADANAIPFAASTSGGGVSVAVSAATLVGGSASIRAAGTLTFAGTPAAGNTVTVTINGISLVYTLGASETTATVAYMVAQFINAHTQLRRFVDATATGAQVSVQSKWGVLTLSSSPSTLANAHGGPLANPLTQPAGITIGSSASTLEEGDWRISYADTNTRGETYPTPYATVSITSANAQIIVIPALALATNATGRNWYMSKAPGEDEMVLVAQAMGASFNILAPPESTAAFPPEYNTTGEEVVRVALGFASDNQTAAILAQAGLTRGNIFAGTYKWPQSNSQDPYTQIKAVYIIASADYAQGTIELNDKALRARLGKIRPKELDLTAVDNYQQARRLSYFDFSKLIDHHWFNTLSSNGLALLLEEDDLICASDDSGGHVNILSRVEDFTIHLSDFTVTINRARRYTTAMFRELVPKTSPVLPSVLQWTATLDTELQILDLPHWREEDAERGGGLHLALWRAEGLGDHRGETIWIDSGSGYKEVAAWDVDAVAGEATDTSDFGAADFGRSQDYSIRVQVRDGATLSTYTEEEFLAGAGLYRSGDEIFQARVATLVGGTDDTYDLTDIIRGRHGTEGFTDTHADGEGFTQLDSRILFVPLEAKYVGKSIKIKAVTVNQDLADAVEHAHTWTGRSRQPLAIARVETDETTGLAPRDSAGSMLLQFWPRTNFKESGDEYLVECMDAAGVEVEHSFPVREGVATAALLVSDVTPGASKYASVSKNSFGPGAGTGSTMNTAASLQKIVGTGNVIQCTLEVPATVSGSNIRRAGIGLVEVARGWRRRGDESYFAADPYPAPAYMLLETAQSGGTVFRSLFCYNSGVEINESQIPADSWLTNAVEVKIVLSGSEVRFYAWDSAFGWRHLGNGVLPVNYPVRVFATVNGTDAWVRDITMTTNPLPTTILSAEQQTEFYGGLENPCRVRIRQYSAGREKILGLPFEELL